MVSVKTRVPTGLALAPKMSVAICDGVAGSPSCTTAQRPSRMTSVSTTAMGQETNVLPKTEMMTTSTDNSQGISRLLKRFYGKLWVEETTETDAGRKPEKCPSG